MDKVAIVSVLLLLLALGYSLSSGCGCGNPLCKCDCKSGCNCNAGHCSCGYKWAHSSVVMDHHSNGGELEIGHYNSPISHSAYYRGGADPGYESYTWPWGGAEIDMAILNEERKDYW